MGQDLFNNISNDYIYPDLPPCPGSSDDGSYIFEFLPNEQVGVISGSDIIAAMDLGDISQPISGWVQQSKILQPGEVTFIQGLTKGISIHLQFFPFDGSVIYTGANHPFYMSADISLNYYKSFKHYDINVFATADPDDGIDIANAFAIKFDELGIAIDVTYEPSGLTFKGQTAGYLFNVDNVDVSLWEPDTSIWGETLYEDSSTSIPAFKYPNGAMLGYVLKVIYPKSVEDSEAYVEINHVPDYLEWFEFVYDATDATCGGCYVRHYDAVDVGISKSCKINTMSGGDYLNYIDTHNKWEKVGPLRIWLSVPDPVNSNIENLITGFYVFNPHDFPVQISYMTIL
jgi:hypothetical protein